MLFLATTQSLGPWTWCWLCVLGSIGLLAMVRPKTFANLANCGGSWVDSNKYLAVLDKRIDIDQHVLPFSRVLGFAVLGSAIILGVLLSRFA